MTDEQQRVTIADVQITIVNISMQKEKAEEYIKLFFQIVKKVKGDAKLITYALLLIDGILEEKRSRIQILVNIQQSKNKNRQEDLIAVLLSFIWQNNREETVQRDLASHILAMLIELVYILFYNLQGS